jgi:hypothetical protein
MYALIKVHNNDFQLNDVFYNDRLVMQMVTSLTSSKSALGNLRCYTIEEL